MYVARGRCAPLAVVLSVEQRRTDIQESIACAASQQSLRKSSTLKPASFSIPANVQRLTGFWRGTVIIDFPLVITTCFP